MKLGLWLRQNHNYAKVPLKRIYKGMDVCGVRRAGRFLVNVSCVLIILY